MEVFEKLLTYVDNNSDLTQSMIDNYKNSMIVLGNQKQMYIPMINSYIGIGMDAYDKLAEDINDHKIPKAVISRGNTITRFRGEIYYAAGSNTSGSRIPERWFANLDNGKTELIDGMIISIRIPSNGLDIVGSCLTIDNNESHFHQIVYNTNEFLTTHFEINTVITLQYDAATPAYMYGVYNSSTSRYVPNGNTTIPVMGVWRVLSTYNTDTDVRYQQSIYYLNSRKVPSNGALCMHTLCMMTNDGKLTSLTLTNNANTNTSKTMYSGYLDPRKVFYYDAETVYGANANIGISGNDYLFTHFGGLIDYRYTFNCSMTLTARSNFYIVGTIDDNGFKLDPSLPWSCSLPMMEDGKVYIYVGMVYTDTNGYRGTLEENNTIYYYKNGAVRIYNEYSELSNHSLTSDLSSLSYLSEYSQNSYTSYIISISSGLYPVNFVNQNNSNSRYYSYSFISSLNNFSLPLGMSNEDALDIHNNDIIRYKEFRSGLYYYANQNALFSTYFRGMLLGVASYADNLYTPRKINGTNFDGSEDITTTYWGNARVFNIADNTLEHYGVDKLVHGDADITLKLPSTIKADIIGNSTYATSSDLSQRTYQQNIRLTNTNFSYHILFTDKIGNNVFAYSYINTNLLYNPNTATLESTYFKGWLQGNADNAIKLRIPRKINGTNFDGSEDITTTYWGADRDITISDFNGAYTYVNTDINGGSNFTLKLPTNIQANINGNADTATYAETTYLSNNSIRTYIRHTLTNSSYYLVFTNHSNTYTYSYINGGLIYNPGLEELTTTYFQATTLFRGQIRARNQWGKLGTNGEGPLYVEVPEATTSQTNDSGGGTPI